MHVFSEAMGRLTNMIQGHLKTRMGDSLTDALIRTYKNSGHLEFWESHLENIYYCHRTLMGCSSTIPVWPLRSNGLSKNTCAKVFNFDPPPQQPYDQDLRIMKANSVNNGTGFNLLINGTSCSEKSSNKK